MQGTHNGQDKFGLERFMCALLCLRLKDPGLYIHGLLGTTNDYERFENSQHNRAINRHRWQESKLLAAIGEKYSHHHKVFNGIKNLLFVKNKGRFTQTQPIYAAFSGWVIWFLEAKYRQASKYILCL
ncbi:hypothetical protein ACOBV8_20055 (plasmid) [Pseudoalteromonas espejiana]